MRMIQLEKVADLHIQPSDLVKLVRKEEILMAMTNGELASLKDAVETEISFREENYGCKRVRN